MKYTFTERVQIITRDSESYVDGRYVPGNETVSGEFAASVQPMSGNDIERLPEGNRSSDAWTIYIRSSVEVDILQNDVDPIEDSSLVLYNGKRYVIVRSHYWPPTMRQSHWKLLVVRETVGA